MKRINIVVPEETLRKRLKEGALANAKESLAMAEEWFPLEEEAWQIATKERRIGGPRKTSPEKSSPA